tara:strand:- start:5273 stop:8056 length:2784 start_codon:yes stop_codon:yes gene_type:complete
MAHYDSSSSAGYFDDPLGQRRDPQTDVITRYLEALQGTRCDLGTRTASDPLATGALQDYAANPPWETHREATVVAFLPYVHQYLVLLEGGDGLVLAKALVSGNLQPLGPVAATNYAVGTSVLLYWRDATVQVPYIVGAVPVVCSDDRKNSASILQGSGNSMYLSQSAYRQLPSLLELDGQIQNYGSGRAMDGTNFEHAITTETGTSFLLDSYQIALSINEGCGLFLNWFDNYCRLSGFQLDVQSYAEHVMQRYDEGENFAFKGGLVYPWESTGNYGDSSTNFTEKYSPDDYQLDPNKPYAHIDLPEADTDLAPIYRYMEYGGYTGQGNTRMLMKPAKKDGQRHAKDSDIDYGLWHESVALDGSYTLRSAKSVFIGKYSLIPIPKRVNPTENQSSGDDYRKENYKFSGSNNIANFGDEHYVADLQPEPGVPKAVKHLVKAASVLDLLAYNYNWKSTHPFYYHKEDYYFPEESELSEEMGDAYYEPAFSDLENQSYLDSPDSKKLHIDHKYGEVEYFQSLSYITMLDDGGVLIGDGYGAQITMIGGQIRLEAPGEVVLMPGTRAVTLCDEFIVRAKSNVELSSSKKDVRLKAEGNMQLLSGNGGEGGMLIQNKASKPWDHFYEGMYGDDVIDSGITLLAKDSGVGALGKDIYVRSDAAGNSGGQLTLDGGQGNSNIAMYGKAIHIFESEGMTLWEGPVGEEPGDMQETHRFHSSGTMHSSDKFIVKGDIISYAGNVVTERSVYAYGDCFVGGKLGHYGSMFVIDLEKADIDVDQIILDYSQAGYDAVQNMISMGGQVFKGDFTELYMPMHLGNNDFITNTMGFSFNDKEGQPYGYTPSKFKILETRWQQAILGGAGKAWTETSVLYQGKQSYPWPGKDNWTDETAYLRSPTLKFFEQGRSSMDKPGDEVKLNELTERAPDGAYTLISGD